MNKTIILLIFLITLLLLLLIINTAFLLVNLNKDKIGAASVAALNDVASFFLNKNTDNIRHESANCEYLLTDNSNIIYIKNLEGLRTGDNIVYKGIVVGTVRIIDFNEGTELGYKVLLQVKENNFKLNKGMLFLVKTRTLNNDKYLEITDHLP